MGTQYLPVHRENLTETLRALTGWLDGRSLRLADLVLLCRHFRMRGIASLLLSGDPEPFFRDLHRSARAFVDGLPMVPEEDRATSRYQPFFDAICCCDWHSAAQIAKMARLSPNQDLEYEEDYYFFRIMIELFFEERPAEAERLLEQFSDLAGSQDEPRIEVCKGFLENDQLSFERGLEGFLDQYNDRWRALENGPSAVPEAVATEGYCCCEGLALLRLAERAGFKTQQHYLLVPSVARVEPAFTWDAEAWRSLGD